MASIATLRDLSEALIESAKQENKLDKITSDVEDFFAVISSTAELKNVLGSSTYELKEREEVTRDIASKRGYDKLTTNFLSYLCCQKGIACLFITNNSIFKSIY